MTPEEDLVRRLRYGAEQADVRKHDPFHIGRMKELLRQAAELIERKIVQPAKHQESGTCPHGYPPTVPCTRCGEHWN